MASFTSNTMNNNRINCELKLNNKPAVWPSSPLSSRHVGSFPPGGGALSSAGGVGSHLALAAAHPSAASELLCGSEAAHSLPLLPPPTPPPPSPPPPSPPLHFYCVDNFQTVAETVPERTAAAAKRGRSLLVMPSGTPRRKEANRKRNQSAEKCNMKTFLGIPRVILFTGNMIMYTVSIHTEGFTVIPPSVL